MQFHCENFGSVLVFHCGKRKSIGARAYSNEATLTAKNDDGILDAADASKPLGSSLPHPLALQVEMCHRAHIVRLELVNSALYRSCTLDPVDIVDPVYCLKAEVPILEYIPSDIQGHYRISDTVRKYEAPRIVFDFHIWRCLGRIRKMNMIIS